MVSPPKMLGRYLLLEEIAAGGMGSVHLAQLAGPAGFARLVALKTLHPQFASDPEFVAMLFDEARLAGTIRHPNVVPILDVLTDTQPIALVMEYVHGITLGRLQRRARERSAPIPLPMVTSLARDLLEGLHAAHEARGQEGEPLGIVHRDVSPQNVIVDAEGVARILDFGIAKAEGRSAATSNGQVKGKAGYMAPEQVRGKPLDRRADVYAAGIVLWELLTGTRFAEGENPLASMLKILEGTPSAPSSVRADVPPELDAIVARALSRDRDARYATAREMALAVEACLAPAPRRDVAAWVVELAGDELHERSRIEKTALTHAELMQSKLTLRRPLLRRALVAALVLASAGAAALMAAAYARGRDDRSTRSSPSPASSTTPSAPASFASVSSIAEPAPHAPAPAPPTSSVSSVASGAPAHGSGKRPLPPGPRAAQKPSTSSACVPPYTVRSDGVHVPKPACL